MADGERPTSSSSPQLAPMMSAASTVTDFKTKALERQMANREKRMRAAAEAPQRTAFLSGLLNQDLQSVSKWHGSRPHHEQKRFVRAVDSIYKGFSKIEGALPVLEARKDKADKSAQAQQAAAYEQVRQVMNQDDPYLRESPRGQMAQSASAPNLTKPIDVFEQNKKKGRGGGGASGAGSGAASVSSSQASQAKNGLDKWLDAMSTATATTRGSDATQMTSLSQMTRTSGASSDCSEPGTHNQMIYRIHKRALAANVRTFGAVDQHEPAYLKEGIPNIGFPECERMATAYRDQFGHMPVGGGRIPREAYASVFNQDKLPMVDKFLESAPTDQKNQVAGMVRSLNYLRLAHHRDTSCVMRQNMDLAENSRLWKPKRQVAVFNPEQRNLSRVPLGALGCHSMNAVAPETPRPSSGTPSIHSPSVSGLGSLPLTPRSLATPMMGGRDMPMMSQPANLASIAEFDC